MGRYKYTIIAGLGLALNLVETWLFGWHWHAQSGAESFWDSLSLILVAWGVIGDILRNVQIHKHYHDHTTNTINTKDVEIRGDRPTVHQNYTFGTTKQETIDLLAKK